MNLPNIDYSLVLQEYDLINWLRFVLDEKNQIADDIVLESVLLGRRINFKFFFENRNILKPPNKAGTAAMDDQCAALLAREGVVQLLVDSLKAKQEDDELVCQIVYVFYQMVFHDVTRFGQNFVSLKLYPNVYPQTVE